VEGSCEHGNEPSGSIKYWEALENERPLPGNIQSRRMSEWPVCQMPFETKDEELWTGTGLYRPRSVGCVDCPPELVSSRPCHQHLAIRLKDLALPLLDLQHFRQKHAVTRPCMCSVLYRDTAHFICICDATTWSTVLLQSRVPFRRSISVTPWVLHPRPASHWCV
jgi:hypothetical protein